MKGHQIDTTPVLRVIVCLRPDLLRRLDGVLARRNERSRSALIREALRRFLATEEAAAAYNDVEVE